MTVIKDDAWPVGTTKYRAVQQSLLDRISGMAAGERLPSESTLCEHYGVSRITLRQAVDGLVNDGRLRREQGRGTFVSEPSPPSGHPERFADTITGFHQQQTSSGQRVATRTLSQQRIPASEAVAAKLMIPTESPVVELVRLRYVNGQLHQHVVTWLPHSRFPDTLVADFAERSLFEFLTERYGVVLVRNDLEVGVEDASREVALNLAVEDGYRLLRIGSTVFGTDETPAAYGIARHTPDNSEIAISLGAGTHTDWRTT